MRITVKPRHKVPVGKCVPFHFFFLLNFAVGCDAPKVWIYTYPEYLYPCILEVWHTR